MLGATRYEISHSGIKVTLLSNTGFQHRSAEPAVLIISPLGSIRLGALVRKAMKGVLSFSYTTARPTAFDS